MAARDTDRLTRPRFADHGEHLTGLDLEADLVDGID